MIPVPQGVRVWLATGHTDMRRGMNGLSLQVQEALGRNPHAGDLPRPSRRSRQSALARRARPVALRQATRTRSLPVAFAR